MATRLKDVDAVMVGMGWTGAIMARELSKAGLPPRPYEPPPGVTIHALASRFGPRRSSIAIFRVARLGISATRRGASSSRLRWVM